MNQDKSYLNLENFIILNKIGEGGFGEVFVVLNKDLGIKYVAKISKTPLTEHDEEFKLSLKREINLLAQINHPYVLKFIGYSPIDFLHRNRPVIITEYLKNGSLYDIVMREKNDCILESWTPTKKLINIFGIASIMYYLHENNIIHRDLKLDNVLFDEYLFPKIADFGLSKIIHKHKKSMTIQSNQGIKGTIIYTAPEILKDTKNPIYTLACDVYSFAFIVYEIINPTFPYQKMKQYEVIDDVVNGKRPKIDESVPKCYKKLIEDCWKQKPKKRPSFKDIVKKLKTEKDFRVGIDSKEFEDYINLIEKCSNENPDLSKFTKIKICSDSFSFVQASDDLFNKLQQDTKEIVFKAKSSVDQSYTFSDDESLKLFATKTFDSLFFQKVLKNFSNVTFELNNSNNINVLSPILQKLSTLYDNELSMLRVNLSVSNISHLSNIVENKSIPISIKIDESVKSIPPKAFYKCKSIYKIDIPSSITSIGDNAFSECSLLEQIIIGSNVNEIGKGLFEECTLLEFVEIQSKIDEIKENTFKRCQSLSKIIMPDSVVKIGKHAFEGCISLEEVDDEFLEQIEYIGEHAFEGCESLKRIIISSKITSVNEGVFIGCSKLNEITIPKSVTTIESNSFYLCKSLNKIIFEYPSSLISIKDRSFKKCKSLTEITIPHSVTVIGSKVFKNCKSLEKVKIPSSVDEIGASTFEGCKKLIEIEMKAPISKINDKLFKGCTSLTEISIPDTVSEIGKKSFYQCGGLKKIILPRYLTKIETKAFFGCEQLEKVSIPKSVQYIGADAFGQCSALDFNFN
ncbi:hypothetical protein M9Y10_007983 [Tritrichomonas musculus]|uniref:Protein kinase domain-containing protein n=1 Tax=Tritrichomonas musculus TaxID=1915356 RepID=A0ABR2J2W1_9EUKA